MKRGLPKVDTAGLESFIPDNEIFQWLEKTENPTPERVREIIQRSLDKNRLEPEEMATLINAGLNLNALLYACCREPAKLLPCAMAVWAGTQ